MIYLTAEQLEHHPKNPRQDIGDISELTESIRKNGIMQNLTVVPKFADEYEKFYVLMGNRRLEAGIAANIDKFPCMIIEDISEKTQIALMLEENMQRNDLTLTEQAQGFQMMMNLGSTTEEIALKTGFSKTTINHRLNIAKLDPKLLQEKEDDAYFQLNIKDLYELERIKDPEKRNEILKKATDSRNIKYAVEQQIRDDLFEKNTLAWTEIFKEKGIKKAPKNENPYNSKWKIVADYPLEKKPVKNLDLKGYAAEEVCYLTEYSRMYIVCPAKDAHKSDYELERDEKARRARKLGAILKEMKDKRRTFCCAFLDSEVSQNESDELVEKVTKSWIAAHGLYLSLSSTQAYYFKTERFALTDEQKEWGKDLSLCKMMMVGICSALDNVSLFDSYFATYKERNAANFITAYEILEKIGFEMTEEECEVIMGTHPLYWTESRELDQNAQEGVAGC